jgi:hypothetical protein
MAIYLKQILTRKSSGGHPKQKKEERKNPLPEEQESMP